MERQIHTLIQGSDEWHQFRLEHFGASEAAAMLGLSKKTTRTELLRMKHTGIAKEFSAWVQENVLDHGHEVEALARPLIESIIGEDLFPATYSLGGLSASCDGITMAGDIAFEHKQYSASLFAAVLDGELPDEHQPQCQQIMLVTGAEKVIFVCSDGTAERMAYVEVFPDPAWQSRITAGWKQFAADLAAYKPEPEVIAPVATPIAALPALVVEITGQVTASNLEQWQHIVIARIQDIKSDLISDQDFADAESTVKFLDDGEKNVDMVKTQAQSKAVSIDELFRALDSIKAEMRTKRLHLEKLIKARKDSIRIEIMDEAKRALREHVIALNTSLGGDYLGVPLSADFAAAIKGKRTVASLREACSTTLLHAKLDLDAQANGIQINLRAFGGIADQYKGLFADLRQLVLKASDDFSNALSLRIAQHEEREAKRKADDQAAMEAAAKATAERERDRIAAEERAKIEQEQRTADAIATVTEAAACKVAVQHTPSAQPSETQSMPAPIAPGVLAGNDPPIVWQQAKASVVTLLDVLTLAELHLVADFINRKAWRKVA